MRIVRGSHEGRIVFGVVDEGDVVVLAGDPLFAGVDTTGERIPLERVQLLAPVIPRSKVIGVGRNYAAHAAELGNDVPVEPLIFLKPNTSVIGPGDPIVLPPESKDVQYEGELALVVGRVTRRVAAADALDHVFGWTIANDVTARDLQKSDGQWWRAKGFDTFCPIGPGIETDLDISALSVETRLDGETVQSGSTRDLIFSVERIVEHVSAAMTLLPGDVILTGTPAGVGPMRAGQTVEVSVEGLGTLRNPVVQG
jgi:2-keto-4-pentenoate hydratase/2-oxohepta-3-ene-1,7-dioic acid hydratase in catechol pathway